MSVPLAVIDKVSHQFGSAEVLKDVCLEIQQGSFTVLLGPSGSGKTTLLLILGGFLTPSQGRIFIAGQDCTLTPPAQRPTTTVFQDYALFPHMSVVANVAFGLRMRGVRAAERNGAALDMLRLVGLEREAVRKPHQLSGGQRQRVALARALIMQPQVLLLDEPLGALDVKLRRQMQDELKALQKRVGMAFIHVTHDQEEAMALADTVIVMNSGRIVDWGTPEQVYSRPRTRFSAGFMGESNILDGAVAKSGKSEVLVSTPLGEIQLSGEAEAGEKISVAIRPENLKLQSGRGARLHLGKARVCEVMFQGSFKRMSARTEGREPQGLVLRVGIEESAKEGDLIDLYCGPSDLVLLRE
jgi:spermidine/putrescine transport system ATP-binding protein